MNKTLSLFFVVAFVLICWPIESNAYPQTFFFEGDVIDVDSDLSSVFNNTQKVSGYFTFETTTEDTNPYENVGIYDGAITDLSFTVGAKTYAASAGNIFVTNESYEDRYVMHAPEITGPEVSGLVPQGFALDLRDYDLLVFSNGSLPISPPPLLEMEDNWGFLSFDLPEGGSYADVEFEFTKLNTVPVPSALWLLGSGLIGLIGFRRKI